MKKEYRVKKSSEIETIIKHRKSSGNQFFVVYRKPNHENKHFRFAVSVSKKYGNAVMRNKIKRQIRDIISKIQIVDQIDIFIVIKTKAVDLTYDQIKEEITKLIKKQNIMR